MKQLDICIGGKQTIPHLLFHFMLPYSGESFTVLTA